MPRKSWISRAASTGMSERSVRASQPRVSGTPSTSTASWRDSVPRSVAWASPREFSRTCRNGISRSASSSRGTAATRGD